MSVYALSDIHGMYNLWEQIKNFLNPDDILYFLGDAADRGPDGYKIMKEMLADKRVIYIKGNHEDFFIKGIAQYLQFEIMDYDIWTYGNGGWDTYLAAIDDEHSALSSIWYQIWRLRLSQIYINKAGQTIYLSHAGFDPDEYFNVSAKDMLWDRTHLVHKWPSIEEYNKVFIVHGHTPTPFLRNDLLFLNKPFVNNDGAVFYCDGHKIDIDCGAFATNATVLLDLDTFETIPIQGDMTNEQEKLLYQEDNYNG